MRDFKLIILSTIALFLSVMNVTAQDSIQVNESQLDTFAVSILTCTPGEELYAKFGHTAILVRDNVRQNNIVFNYGCFNYNSDNFMYKFLLGQTDYILGAEDLKNFMYRYSYMGNGVTEQTLNLSREETNKLVNLLFDNLRPENQEYRYNWLYDNCTERARDIIEKAVDGNVDYAAKTKDTTVRKMLNKCLENDLWSSFGINLILGEEIDNEADKRIQMFIPDVYRAEVDEAYIVRSDGRKEKLISSKRIILDETNCFEKASMVTSPLTVAILLLIISVILLGFEMKTRRYCAPFDVALHLIQGFAGIIVSFLFFFSEHPAVDSNWLVILFNPIAIIYSIWIIYCCQKKKKNYLAYANVSVIVTFCIIMIVCQQTYSHAMYIVVAILLIRSISQIRFISK